MAISTVNYFKSIFSKLIIIIIPDSDYPDLPNDTKNVEIGQGIRKILLFEIDHFNNKKIQILTKSKSKQ